MLITALLSGGRRAYYAMQGAGLCNNIIVLQQNSDLGVDLALKSTQCFMTVFDTTWPIYC